MGGEPGNGREEKPSKGAGILIMNFACFTFGHGLTRGVECYSLFHRKCLQFPKVSITAPERQRSKGWGNDGHCTLISSAHSPLLLRFLTGNQSTQPHKTQSSRARLAWFLCYASAPPDKVFQRRHSPLLAAEKAQAHEAADKEVSPRREDQRSLALGLLNTGKWLLSLEDLCAPDTGLE